MFGHSYRSSDEMNFPTWIDRATIELKWCLWPRRCYITGERLWLTKAYKTRRFFRAGDIDMISEDRWYSRYEFLIARLKYGV